MKHTLRNVFHSPRFLVGFIIFMSILLTVLRTISHLESL